MDNTNKGRRSRIEPLLNIEKGTLNCEGIGQDRIKIQATFRPSLVVVTRWIG
jgi:hypothetical protein